MTYPKHACRLGLEGIVSKRRDSRYSSGATPNWVKSKNPQSAAVKREATEDQTVPISFWSYGSCGPTETSRSIDVPTWADISGNYPPRVAGELDALMRPEYRLTRRTAHHTSGSSVIGGRLSLRSSAMGR